MPRNDRKPTTSVMVVTNGPEDTAGSTPSRVSSQRDQDAAERRRRQHRHHRQRDDQAEVGDVEPERRDDAHDQSRRPGR